MLQGRRMATGHRGMRKGISLVEMLIAIIVFGVISAIGYSYYKNFYDVSLSAKQTRVSAIVDQATQLSNAYDLYVMKTGSAPANIAALSASTVGILTERPIANPDITATGWVLSTSLEFGGATATNDTGFVYEIDKVGISPADELEYCNILNNIANSSWELDAAYAQTTAGDVGTQKEMYDGTNATLTKFHCGGGSATTLFFTFVKEYDAS